jgi:hypothetical protein
MKLRVIILLLFVFISFLANGQAKHKEFSLAIGVTEIGLFIERTDIYRWMPFPSIMVNISRNDHSYYQFSFAAFDIRNYRGAGSEKYVETPPLNSYDEAIMYIGKKVSLSDFNSYTFGGIAYSLNSKSKFQMLGSVEVGFRFGQTSVIESVYKRPASVQGFELHTSTKSSTMIGARFNFGSKIILTDLVSIDLAIGSYAFPIWPYLQPNGRLQIGFSL